MFVTNNAGVMCEDGSDCHEELTSPLESNGADLAPWDFYGAQTIVKKDTQQPGLIQLPEAQDSDDPDLLEPLEEFYWANAPPIPNTILAASLFGYLPDQSEEPEDEDHGFQDFQRPPDAAVVSVQAPTTYFPDETEEEDQDFGGTDFQLPPDVVAPTQLFGAESFPPEEEQEPEDFGFADSQLPPDDTGQTTASLPDQADEPEDEDYGFADWQLPPDDTGRGYYAPDEIEEPEDQDFGGIDFQLPSDDTGQTTSSFPDQSEEPEDEDFGFTDSQVPPDFAAPDTQVYQTEAPAEVEEPEPEDFGHVDWQDPGDDTGTTVVYDSSGEAEEPDDEDFGGIDFQLPEDAAPLEQPLTLVYFPDEAEEPEDEDFGVTDSQIPEDFIPPPPPPPVTGSVGGGGAGGGRELHKLFRKKLKPEEIFPGRLTREVISDMGLQEAKQGLTITPEDPDEDDDILLLS